MARGGFAAFAADCLSLSLGETTVRAMFGGHGIYHGGVMIGLVADETLYLKTDAETVRAFADAGCEPFVYETRDGRRTIMSYYSAPDGSLDEPEALAPWARMAAEAAMRAAAAKPPKRARGLRPRA